jgi:hypothetical protein
MYSTLVEHLFDVTDDELTERFRALELERRRIEAEMAAVMRAGHRRALHTVDGHRTMRHWARAQINCPAAHASTLQRLAGALDTVGGLGDALRDGHIGVAQATEFARLRAHPRVGGQLDSVSPLLLRHAEQLSYEEFRVVARRWETLADLDGAQRDDDASHERRTATVLEVGGALDVAASGGSGLVTAEMIGIFRQFVEAEFDKDVAARKLESGEVGPASALPRTDAQRRFDALVAIFHAAAVAPADGVAPRPVVNLLVGQATVERLVKRRITGDDPGPGGDLDLALERIESDSGVRVSPDDVLAAAVIGHVRRVVVDGSGVVVDAGRKRRLFTGVAREMALLLAHSCGHLGCTVPARFCEVDHLAEWERDDGGTDQHNGFPRCGTHNPWKTAHRLRSRRDRFGNVVDLRRDGSAMTPVGRRMEFHDPAPPDGRSPDEAIASWERRVVRIARCRLHVGEVREALADVVALDRRSRPS